MNYRVSMDMYCPMKMHYFPFDKQKCNMTIETCKYLIKGIVSNSKLSFKLYMCNLHYELSIFKREFLKKGTGIKLFQTIYDAD